MERLIGAEIRTLTNLLKREVYNEGEDNSMCNTSLHGLVIEFLFENKDRDIFQRDFEETFSMRRSTASRMLKLMENKGLIERISVSEDARLKKIVLTSQAISAYESIKEIRTKIENKMIKDISEDDLKIFFKVIDKIKENLE